MNYDEFINTYNGKGFDYDGVAQIQCVDLVKMYLDKVFGIKPGSWGDARAYYENYNNNSVLKTNFDRIIGMEAIVTEEISKNKIGEVKVDGKRWSAYSDKKIKVGSTVRVLSIEGVKLKVIEVKGDE